MRRRISGRRNRGYIIEQLLISLAVCAFLIPVAASIIAILIRSVSADYTAMDETAIAQLRHVIAVSDDFECRSSELQFYHHGSRQRLHLVNGNLVLTSPGTQIFLTNLSDISFSEEGGIIYLHYAHPEEETQCRCLGHV